MRLKSAFAAAFGLALLGCSDNPNEPVGASGSLSFSYTGAGATSSTTYSASGTAPLNLDGGTNAWAVGAVSATENQSVVVASVPKSSTTWDQVVIGIDRASIGTSNVSADCTDEESCTGTGVFITFGSNSSGSSFTYFCTLATGTVTISTLSSTSMTGSFSGSGVCATPTGVETAFTITNGTFNVGITQI